jgi:hypothetical protein
MKILLLLLIKILVSLKLNGLTLKLIMLRFMLKFKMGKLLVPLVTLDSSLLLLISLKPNF